MAPPQLIDIESRSSLRSHAAIHAASWKRSTIVISPCHGAGRLFRDPRRRLHLLPWALAVPLRVHGHYSRAGIEAA